jgi:diguanylate cyclase (GGDEF)-like protein
MPDANLGNKLEAVRAVFRAKLQDRLDEIEYALSVLTGKSSDGEAEAALERLHFLCHKLAGAGAMFGMPEMGDAARRIEDACASIIKGGEKYSTAMQGQLDNLVQGLLKIPPSAGEAPAAVDTDFSGGTESAKDTASIVIVGEDGAEIGALVEDLSQYGFSARTSGFAELSNTASHDRPAALIVVGVFDSDVDSGTETVRDLLQSGNFDCPAIFLSGRDDAWAYVMAVRMGAVAYLSKPAKVAEVADVLDKLMVPDSGNPCRVLIVDDDESTAHYLEAVLQDAGMDTSMICTPTEVLEGVRAFQPELILMDMYMPDFDGGELAAAIRLHAAYRSIPIVFLSGETDRERQMLALSSGGDDFLNKTISPEHLASSIRNRVERFRALRSLIARDSMTGLYNHTATNDLLRVELARSERANANLALATLDIDHFKSVNDTHGHGVGDQVIKSLARLLRQRLRKSDIIGRVGGEEFYVVLTGADGSTAKGIMDGVREDFWKIKHQSEQGPFSVSLSCDIASFPAEKTHDALSEAADKALYAAKGSGRNRVVLANAKP